MVTGTYTVLVVNLILKEIKPSAKALKIAHNKIDECVEKENRH